ncbi:argininosuccinate lyase [candidate division KSB1 bacterium]
MKLWDKGKSVNKDVLEYTVGDDYILDNVLVKYDCIASIAHAKMLGKIGLVNKNEVRELVNGLKEIIKLHREGKFEISPENEDCHTAIENYLIKKLGETGKKIHTARSRNDQVLTALRLYYKEELNRCSRKKEDLIVTLKDFKKKYGRIVLPGYTHSRKAMPSSIGLWAGSFIDALKDDLKLVGAAYDLIDQSPLGTGAGYGLPVKIDRKYTADLLGFSRIQANPVYVQNSRGKFESTILHALSQIMFDLNKISSDLIVFTLPELGYFSLPEEFCTGSSIMPHKKNPDVLEILRANYHKVVSFELLVKQVSANLLSGYNRDQQLTKGPVIKGLELTHKSILVADKLFRKLKVNRQNCKNAMTNELYSAEEAYELVKKGIPFRSAYREISKKY